MKQTKKHYVTPTLKEHGVVREITQSGSGDRDPGMGKGRGMSMSWSWSMIFDKHHNPGKH
jgi:hypothetical protein